MNIQATVVRTPGMNKIETLQEVMSVRHGSKEACMDKHERMAEGTVWLVDAYKS